MDSRIIIDTYAWNRFNPNRQVSPNSLGKEQAQAQSWDGHGEDEDDDVYTDYGDDDLDDDIDAVAQASELKPKALTKEQLLLCSATLRGYSLKNKNGVSPQ